MNKSFDENLLLLTIETVAVATLIPNHYSCWVSIRVFATIISHQSVLLSCVKAGIDVFSHLVKFQHTIHWECFTIDVEGGSCLIIL